MQRDRKSKLEMKKFLLTFFGLFLFWNMPVNAKSISDQKDEQFCLPKDISKGTGCVWQVSKRTKGLEHQIQIVTKEEGHAVRDGKLSLRFEVRPGECWGSFDKKDLANDNQPDNDCERTNGKSERAEMGTKKFYKGKKWYAWSIYIPEGQEFLSPSSLKLFQFDHNDGSGYQQLANFDHGDGKYTFFNAVADFEESKSVDVIGKWTDIVVNANWTHKDNGYYKIWADGKMIYDYQGPTFYAKNLKANIKIGVYRNWLDRIWELGRDGGTTVVYYDEIRFGKSEKSLELDYKLETEIKKSEAELIKDEIAVLTAKAKKNYDVEISKKIKKLKRKLRRLESN